MAAKQQIFCEYFNMGAGKCKCPGYVENPSKWSKGKCKRCTHAKSKHNFINDNDEAPKEEAKKAEPEPQYQQPQQEQQQEEQQQEAGGDYGDNEQEQEQEQEQEEQGGDYGDNE